LLAAVRAALGNDLDTVGALAAVDSWAATATGQRGDDAPGRRPDDDSTAPGLVRDLVDALLGIAL
jgi:L-cysteine:1D-myo-inositol 2-amino-2-deoxy-alpha-D-glucopyranoside ligase